MVFSQDERHGVEFCWYTVRLPPPPVILHLSLFSWNANKHVTTVMPHWNDHNTWHGNEQNWVCITFKTPFLSPERKRTAYSAFIPQHVSEIQINRGWVRHVCAPSELHPCSRERLRSRPRSYTTTESSRIHHIHHIHPSGHLLSSTKAPR